MEERPIQGRKEMMSVSGLWAERLERQRMRKLQERQVCREEISSGGQAEV